MRALHIVAGLDPQHGGPSYSVPRLCTALRKQDVEAHLLTVHEANTPCDSFISAQKQDFAGIPLFRALRLSSDLDRAARIEAATSDVVHSHGLWLMPNVYAGHAGAAVGCPVVISPRGMLAPEALAFSARKKRLFWRFLQGPAYARAAIWHATSPAEAEEIRAFGVRAPIAIIPNGVDIPNMRTTSLRSESKLPTILFLGRLHPKKGLPDLVAAWSLLADERPGWILRIVGPDEGRHRAELEKMVLRIGVPRVVFGGPVYGVEKEQVLAEADLFVLPTRNENFGIAVAEALATAVPAIVSRGAPWSCLETERCGWWIERGVESLVGALRAATALPEAERREMGGRARAMMARDFGWERIAHEMRAVYKWAIGTAERPSTVQLD